MCRPIDNEKIDKMIELMNLYYHKPCDNIKDVRVLVNLVLNMVSNLEKIQDRE